MQTIHFLIADDKTVSTPDSPILIEGESMTSEIVVTRIPADWEGYELRLILTTPGKIKMQSIPVGAGVPVTNAMLDSGGRLTVEFGAYQGATKIYRSRITNGSKLTVHGASDDGSINPPDALPNIIAEASTVILAANNALAEIVTALPAASVMPEMLTMASTAVTNANAATSNANDAATEVRTAIPAAVAQAQADAEAQVALAEIQAGHAEDSAILAANNILNGLNTHNTDNTSHPSLIEDIRTVEAIARGRATAYVFDTLAALNAWVAIPENAAQLVVGDNLYIRALNVKDRWWDGTQIQPLESEAPDLTNYYLKTQVDAMMPIIIGQAAYDALVAAGTVDAGRIYYVTGV